MGGLSLLTGLAVYKPVQLHWLTAALGGYEWARWEHFWLTVCYVAFFVLHLAQVIRAGWGISARWSADTIWSTRRNRRQFIAK